MIMTRFTTILAAGLSLLSFVGAAPLTLNERDVADPPVTAPNASTVWVVGDTQTVVWDTTQLPSQITNKIGTVVLGFVNDTTGNEHLMLDSPLASGFDITTGHIDIVVPSVQPRSDYIIALMGSSGNISPKFTITNLPGQVPTTTGSVPPGSSIPEQTFTTVGATDPSGTSATVTGTDPTTSSVTGIVSIPSGEAPTTTPLPVTTVPIEHTPIPTPSNGTSSSLISTTNSTTTTTTSGTASSQTANGAHRMLSSRLMAVVAPLLALWLFV